MAHPAALPKGLPDYSRRQAKRLIRTNGLAQKRKTPVITGVCVLCQTLIARVKL